MRGADDVDLERFKPGELVALRRGCDVAVMVDVAAEVATVRCGYRYIGSSSGSVQGL